MPFNNVYELAIDTTGDLYGPVTVVTDIDLLKQDLYDLIYSMPMKALGPEKVLSNQVIGYANIEYPRRNLQTYLNARLYAIGYEPNLVKVTAERTGLDSMRMIINITTNGQIFRDIIPDLIFKVRDSILIIPSMIYRYPSVGYDYFNEYINIKKNESRIPITYKPHETFMAYVFPANEVYNEVITKTISISYPGHHDLRVLLDLLSNTDIAGSKLNVIEYIFSPNIIGVVKGNDRNKIYIDTKAFSQNTKTPRLDSDGNPMFNALGEQMWEYEPIELKISASVSTANAVTSRYEMEKVDNYGEIFGLMPNNKYFAIFNIALQPGKYIITYKRQRYVEQQNT